jgi:hypothetical protein
LGGGGGGGSNHQSGRVNGKMSAKHRALEQNHHFFSPVPLDSTTVLS